MDRHLRNLNQVGARGRICGTPYYGVVGSQVPSSGTNGPGFGYNDLSLPADAEKELRWTIVTWPASGVLRANEDTSFSLIGAGNGEHYFEYQLSDFQVDIGPVTRVDLEIGVVDPVVISCAVGSAAATGLQASVTNSTVISCGVGVAQALGLTADITTPQSSTILCSVGVAEAIGLQASLPQPSFILCKVGIALARGLRASISEGTPNPNPPTLPINVYVGEARIRIYSQPLPRKPQ